MLPTIGRTVHYRLSEQDAERINKRRSDAETHRTEHCENSNGVVLHVGNTVRAGDVFPLVITRVWAAREGGLVNGQVLLDGSDQLWVTSVIEGDIIGSWFVPPRV